ncbi:MAG: hypothetical protein KGH65_05210 [Candidatus Micrarchaeota archaeon]|nr:hypothetical protein [Candidatus Micrarchaeota archaeon]
MLTNTRKNCMGTVSFDGKFDGMRKAQDFIVYPMHQGMEANCAKIQSDTRIGFIHLKTGRVDLSKSHPGGAYGVHLIEATSAGTLTAEELLMLKSAIFATASGKAGNNTMHVFTDNSAALEVFKAA